MGKKILIAEDNVKNRLILRDILSFHGYAVIEAENGQIAVELAISEKPDLVLMDLQMPKADGFKALEDLRKNPETARIPVIAVTASAMRADKEKVLSSGFDGYVSKPFDMKELVALVKQQLGDQ